jgi:diaminopropionate ammonia-lyase
VAAEGVTAPAAWPAVRAAGSGRGALTLAPGPHRSVMAGLNCGLASPLALPAVAVGFAGFVPRPLAGVGATGAGCSGRGALALASGLVGWGFQVSRAEPG